MSTTDGRQEIPGVLCRQETREIDHPLTAEEWADRSESMALTLERVRLHDEYAAKVRKFLASEKAKITVELEKLGRAVARHSEPREVTVDVFVDNATGRTFIVRETDTTKTPHTGLVHTVKAATPNDLADAARVRQMGLPGMRKLKAVGEPPPMPDLEGDGNGNGEKLIRLCEYTGDNAIRATAALANAFGLTVSGCRSIMAQLEDGEEVDVGRLGGAALTMGVDQLRMAGFEVETIDPAEIVPDGPVPEALEDIDDLEGGELDAAVQAVVPGLVRIDDETDLEYRARARRAYAARAPLAVGGVLPEIDGTGALGAHFRGEAPAEPEPEPEPVVIVGLELVSGGEKARRIGVVKVVREATGLGLADAKRLADNAPSVMLEQIAEAEAEAIVAKIAKAGGEARVIPVPATKAAAEPELPEPTPAELEPDLELPEGETFLERAMKRQAETSPEPAAEPEGGPWPWGWVHANDIGEGCKGSVTTALRELGFSRSAARGMIGAVEAYDEPKGGVVVYVNPKDPTTFPLTLEGDNVKHARGDVSVHEVAAKLREAGLAAEAVEVPNARQRADL